MMKKYLFLFFACSFLYGCKSEKIKLEGVDFETAEYYDSFLFVPAKSKPSSKVMEISFNDWAKFNKSFATLMMCYYDEESSTTHFFGKESCPSTSIFLNNKLCIDGEIKLDTRTDNRLDLRIEFAPDAEERMYNGYIIILNSLIDRINSIDSVANNTKIFEWNVRYNIVMNPLKKAIFIFLGFLISVLFIWFVFLRNIFYRKMGKGKIVINEPYLKNIKIAGKRELVFSTKANKQKYLSKLFTGGILYETNPIWDKEIIFRPKNKRSVSIRLGLDYTITPYTNVLVKGKSYEIKKGKEIIKITFI